MTKPSVENTVTIETPWMRRREQQCMGRLALIHAVHGDFTLNHHSKPQPIPGEPVICIDDDPHFGTAEWASLRTGARYLSGENSYGHPHIDVTLLEPGMKVTIENP